MTDMRSLIEDVESTLTPYFKDIERIALINQKRYQMRFMQLKLQKVIYQEQLAMDMMILDVIIQKKFMQEHLKQKMPL